MVEFRNYLDWSRNGIAGEHKLHKWLLKRLPYVVSIDNSVNDIIDLRCVGDLSNDLWSAYYSGNTYHSFYHFKDEADAVAFKLKFS